MSDLWSDLNDLQRAWGTAYPRRAQGGQVSIRGFDYQIKLFLLRVVERWLHQTPIERVEYKTFIPLMESVSDILAVDKGIIVASQVKFTLRSGALGDALDEFALIYNMVRENFPRLMSVIRFQLLSNSHELQDITKSIERWIDKDKMKVDTDFKSLLSVSTETNPEHRLMALLANELQCPEPLTVLHKWIGVVMDASVNGTFLEHAGKTIWDQLHSIWRNLITSKSGLYIWQSNDIAPSDVIQGAVLTGQRPNIRHLRDGYFNRRDIYEDLENVFFKWVDEVIEERDYSDKIPVFWIGGRSGSGKSVALLHLLSELNQRGVSPIIWLGHHTSLLAPGFHFGLNNHTDPISVIGMDDPYVIEEGVSHHWDDFFASAHSLRQNEGSLRMPILIACGPTEQADLFRSDYGEHASFFRYDMPHDTSKEHEVLQEWYYRRTGNPPPPIDNENTLLVQLFFQWDKHETIAEFSTRLKKRLSLDAQDNVILNKVSRILALNRLYVGYSPSSVRHELSPLQADQLDWLEADLHLGEREVGGKNGYWLLHAHLANSVFLNWYGNRPSSYKEYFKQAALDCFDHGKKPIEQTAALWVIAQILGNVNNTELRSRMDINIARQLAADIYKEIIARQNPLPLSILPVWVDISLSTPELHLSPDPVEAAISKIHPNMYEETGLRLTCHKLLQHFGNLKPEEQAALTNAIIHLLMEVPSWPGWVYVAEHVIKTTRDTRFIPLLKQRLLYPSDFRTANLLRLALHTWPSDEEIHELVIRTLSNTPCNLFWCDIAKQFIQTIQRVPTAVYQWIYNFRKLSQIRFVLGEALKLDYALFEQIALEWVAIWNQEVSANYVLEPLLRKRSGDQNVRDYSKKWLQVGAGDKSFVLEILLEKEPTQEVIEYAFHWLEASGYQRSTSSYLLEKLLSIEMFTDQTLDFTVNWLSEHNRSTTWPVLWISCIRKHPDNPVLFSLGIDWLEFTDASHRFWGYVLQFLCKINPHHDQIRHHLEKCSKMDIYVPDWVHNWISLFPYFDTDQVLLEMGIQWLETNELSDPSWPTVCSILCENAIEHPSVLALSERFLKLNDTESMWPKVWQSTYKRHPNADWLLVTALNWLHRNDNHGSWNFVWKAIYSNNRDNDSIVKLGMHWLEKNEFHRGWSYVWQDLFSEDPYHPLLIQMGIRFLERLEDAEAWSYVWQHFQDKLQDHKLIYNLGIKWLKKANPSSPGWPIVWQQVYLKTSKEQEITDLGIKWLTQTEPAHSAWSYVWNAIVNNSWESSLFDLGVKFLRNSDNGDNWNLIWFRLTKIVGMTDDLFNIGLNWLLKVDGERKYWDMVWLHMLKSEREQEKILEIGLDWLRRMDIHQNNFEQIWGFVYKQLPQEPLLHTKALQYLSHYPSTKPGEWLGIWNALLKNSVDKTSLIRIGFEFLKEVDPKQGIWTHAWHILYKEWPQNSTLNKSGMEWLLQNDKRLRDWPQLWLKVYPTNPTKNLRVLATHWLKNKNYASRGEWPLIWLILHNHCCADWTAKLGLEWLTLLLSNKSSSWAKVCIALLRTHRRHHAKLLHLGNIWVKNAIEDIPDVAELKIELKRYG